MAHNGPCRNHGIRARRVVSEEYARTGTRYRLYRRTTARSGSANHPRWSIYRTIRYISTSSHRLHLPSATPGFVIPYRTTPAPDTSRMRFTQRRGMALHTSVRTQSQTILHRIPRTHQSTGRDQPVRKHPLCQHPFRRESIVLCRRRSYTQ